MNNVTAAKNLNIHSSQFFSENINHILGTFYLMIIDHICSGDIVFSSISETKDSQMFLKNKLRKTRKHTRKIKVKMTRRTSL